MHGNYIFCICLVLCVLRVLIFVKRECRETGRSPLRNLLEHIFFSFCTQRQKRTRQKKVVRSCPRCRQPTRRQEGEVPPGHSAPFRKALAAEGVQQSVLISFRWRFRSPTAFAAEWCAQPAVSRGKRWGRKTRTTRGGRLSVQSPSLDFNSEARLVYSFTNARTSASVNPEIFATIAGFKPSASMLRAS